MVDEALESSDSGCFALVSNECAEMMKQCLDESRQSPPLPQTVMGIDFGHYVKILDIAYDEYDVELTVFTWGEAMTVTIPRDYFEKNCHGILITKFTTPFTLENSQEPDSIPGESISLRK